MLSRKAIRALPSGAGVGFVCVHVLVLQHEAGPLIAEEDCVPGNCNCSLSLGKTRTADRCCCEHRVPSDSIKEGAGRVT